MELQMKAERRSFPRYAVTCPVRVTLPNDGGPDCYDAEIKDLSRTSIKIEGSAELVLALLGQIALQSTCSLQFTLPSYQHAFTIEASVLSHRRLSEQLFVIVLLLHHTDSQQEILLENQLNLQWKLIAWHPTISAPIEKSPEAVPHWYRL
jgi:hypothetical protein